MSSEDERSNKVRYKKGCVFCEAGRKGLTQEVPFEDPTTKRPIGCVRGFYEKSEHCIVTLALEQYSLGHTLVILEQHAEDMSDENVTPDEYLDLCKTIRDVSNILKAKLKADRVYVCSLCDGVEHLHFHLIPRYETDVRGFNFVGDREKLFAIGFTIGPEPNPLDYRSRAKWIELIAEKLRK